jgi:hypothetical protein
MAVHPVHDASPGHAPHRTVRRGIRHKCAVNGGRCRTSAARRRRSASTRAGW